MHTIQVYLSYIRTITDIEFVYEKVSMRTKSKCDIKREV